MRIAQIPEQPELEALGRLYKNISDDIVADLLSIDLLNYSELKANQIRKKVDSNIRRMNTVAVKSSKILIPDAYGVAEKRSVTALRILGRDNLKDPELAKAHDLSIQKYIDETNDYLITANGSIRKTTNNYLFITKQISGALMQLEEFGGGILSDEDQDFMLDQINVAVDKGVSRGAVSRRLRDHIQHRLGDRQLMEINGRYYRPDKYATLVARTEMRFSQTDATVNTCNQYGNDLVQVSDHGTTTEICEEFEGEVYSISGKDPDHSLLIAWPPFHPNCKHFLTPTSKEAIAFESTYKGD